MLLKLKKDKPTLTTLCGLKPDHETEANFKWWGSTARNAKLLAPEILVHASAGTCLKLYHNSLGKKGEAVLRKAVQHQGRSGFELDFD